MNSIRQTAADKSPHVSDHNDKAMGMCVNPSSLIGAATAVSVGLSSAIQQVRDLHRPVDASVNGFASRATKSSDEGFAMKRITLLRNRLNNMLEEKKEDPFSCGYDCDDRSKMTRVQESMEDSTNSTSISSSDDRPLQKSQILPAISTKSSKSKVSPSRVTWESQKVEKNSVHGPSPIARVRNNISDDVGTDPTSPSPRTTRKSQEQIKREKQRRWKQKMKIAQKQRMVERRTLDGDNDSPSEFLVNGRALATMIGVQVLHLIDNQCGAADDTLSDSSESLYESLQGDTSRESGSSQSSNTGNSKPLSRTTPLGKSKHANESKVPEESLPTENHQRTTKSNKSLAGTSENHHDDAATSSSLMFEDSRATLGSSALAKPGRTAESRYSMINSDTKYRSIPPPISDARITNDRCATFSDVSNVSSAASTKMDIKDSAFVKAFVHDMVKAGFPFFWQKEVMMINPSNIIMRMKPGYRTPQGTYCGPRLVWQESEFEMYGVNLFDIQKLERAGPTQLKEYPYSYPSRAVYLQMNRGQEFIFEAPTENDAIRFVHGMRWLIARLTFNLVIGNMDVVFELLDEGTSKKTPPKLGQVNWLDDSRRATAMDDMTEQLVERSVVFFTDEQSHGSF